MEDKVSMVERAKLAEQAERYDDMAAVSPSRAASESLATRG